jgi:predicted O-methyltransferase YrrM
MSFMKHVVRVARIVLRSSPVRHVAARLQMAPWLFVPPGHFYSPIPALDSVRRDEQRIFPPVIPRELPGIELDEVRQLAMLDELQPYYDSQPFEAEKTRNLRYFFENPMYSYSDAIFLHCMIRHARPRRIIEIGSGYSSCVTLDTNELFFDNRIACTFVEPYPQLLRTLLRDDDLTRIEILDRDLQEISLDRFRALEPNDILFIDSTHVAKIGSDVNFIFAEILPVLCPGVYVHFHDIFYPFEYPKEWIYEGRAWTEAYLLRAFLTFNRAYEIVLFNTFLESFHRDRFIRRMPLCLKNEGGSIWLRRRRYRAD